MHRPFLAIFVVCSFAVTSAFATTTSLHRRHRRVVHSTAARIQRVSYTTRTHRVHRTLVPVRTVARRHRVSSPWTSPTYADSATGDSINGEDLLVRQAAVKALGPYNGSVVVADPNSGRILTIVNQKLALHGAFEPCSTIKIVAALAGLSEGIINQDSSLRITRRHGMDLTVALAHSNNAYFAAVGQKLGYDKVVEYGQMFGLGEKAGLNIEGEQPGLIADTPPSDGMGMMTSFGEGFSMTPLELTAIVSAVANGGTLYYLQHPSSQQDIDQFVPVVKRRLELGPYLTEIKPGMMGAVEYGTARRIGFSAADPIFGKTGTCTDNRTPTHLGWFGSYNEVGGRKLVVVVLLTGGYGVSGPVASGIAGNVYKNLSDQNYFASAQEISPAALLGATPAY